MTDIILPNHHVCVRGIPTHGRVEAQVEKEDRVKTASISLFRLLSVSLLLLALCSMAIMIPSQTQAGNECPRNGSYMTEAGLIRVYLTGVCVTQMTGYPTSAMPCSVPPGYSFPYGMIKFGTIVTASNGVGTIQVSLPNPYPLGAKYFNCVNGTLVDIGSQFTRVNEYTLLWTVSGSGDYIMCIALPYSSATPQSSSPWLPEMAKAPMQLSNIGVKTASLSATKVAPGEKVTVTANVANTGTGNGSSVIKVYINGAEESQQGVSVTSGGTTSVTFDVTRNQPGTYTVYVGSTNAGSFTVDEFTPNTVLFISGALVFFALIIGVIWMSRRRA